MPAPSGRVALSAWWRHGLKQETMVSAVRTRLPLGHRWGAVMPVRLRRNTALAMTSCPPSCSSAGCWSNASLVGHCVPSLLWSKCGNISRQYRAARGGTRRVYMDKQDNVGTGASAYSTGERARESGDFLNWHRVAHGRAHGYQRRVDGSAATGAGDPAAGDLHHR